MKAVAQPPSARSTRGHGAAWLALSLLLICGVLVSMELTARFSGGLIVVRDWMKWTNTVVLAAHLGCVGWVLFTLPATTGRIARRLLGLAAGLLALHLSLPYWHGQGPWAPGEPIVTLHRQLTFVPSFLRDLAGLAVVLASRSAFRVWPLAALAFGVSAMGTVWIWTQTPFAVLARTHGAGSALPWVGASVLGTALLGLHFLRARAATRLPE